MKITMDYWDFAKIQRGCTKFVEKSHSHRVLRFIELRAKDGHCVATALDGYGLWQVKVPCTGEGVALIPAIKPYKADEVTIIPSGKGRVLIEYWRAGGELIVATEYPVDENKYFNWGNILPRDREGDRYIACAAKLLKDALEALKNTSDIVYIGIPQEADKPMTLAAGQSQAVVLPVRINNGTIKERAWLEDWR